MAAAKRKKKKAAKRAFDLKTYVVGVLRRASYRNPQRTTVLREAKVGYNNYKCVACRNSGFGRRDISIDHVEPVVPTTGWAGWDSFISRLFCGVEGLQALCKECHKAKTARERKERAKWRTQNKAK